MLKIFNQLTKLDNGSEFWTAFNQSTTPKEFNSWATKHSNQLKKALKELGFTTFNKVSKGHFYYSLFVHSEATGWVYLSISDVRNGFLNQILIRTASSNKDFAGSTNNYIGLTDFERFDRDLRGFVSTHSK